MNILIFGGTGAIGIPLCKILYRDKNNNITVTSRNNHSSSVRLRYIKGNAIDEEFCRKVLLEGCYDAIIDFIVRPYSNLKKLLPIFLANTKQYVFISSARVYGECKNGTITESTPRLLDISEDDIFLSTNEYSLAKAREENLILKSGHKNFTIIRPSITYNTHRLQLGVFEKEDWLYRALQGKSIVFSLDLMDRITTNTCGDDVAAGIASIIGKPKAMGRIFHITQPKAVKWSEILDVYIDVLKKRCNHPIKVKFTNESTNFLFPGKKYQLLYCRYYDRKFDNSAINQFVNTENFEDPLIGLKVCLEHFLNCPKFAPINWELEAVHDKITNERQPLLSIKGFKNKVTYLLCRNNMRQIYRIIRKLKK